MLTHSKAGRTSEHLIDSDPSANTDSLRACPDLRTQGASCAAVSFRALGIFAEGIFAEGFFTERNFREIFTKQNFRRTELIPNGIYFERNFRPMDFSPSEFPPNGIFTEKFPKVDSIGST